MASVELTQISYPKASNTWYILDEDCKCKFLETQDMTDKEPKYTKEEWIERTKKESEANQKHLMLSEAGVKIGTVIKLARQEFTLVGFTFNEETLEYDYNMLEEYSVKEVTFPFNYFIAAGVFNKDDVAVDKEADEEIEADSTAS